MSAYRPPPWWARTGGFCAGRGVSPGGVPAGGTAVGRGAVACRGSGDHNSSPRRGHRRPRLIRKERPWRTAPPADWPSPWPWPRPPAAAASTTGHRRPRPAARRRHRARLLARRRPACRCRSGPARPSARIASSTND